MQEAEEIIFFFPQILVEVHGDVTHSSYLLESSWLFIFSYFKAVWFIYVCMCLFF